MTRVVATADCDPACHGRRRAGLGPTNIQTPESFLFELNHKFNVINNLK